MERMERKETKKEIMLRTLAKAKTLPLMNTDNTDWEKIG
jgi:hypothetical protein